MAGLKEIFPHISDDVLKLNPQGNGKTPQETAPGKPQASDKAVGRRKYHNTPTTYQGKRYQTKGEARKAQELDLLIKAGEIDFYLTQVNFPLPGNCSYRADFVTFRYFVDPEPEDESRQIIWKVKVIEVKQWRKAINGFWFTPDARIKMNLFRETYPNLELEVCR